MSVLLSVPLGPHPPQSGSEDKTPYQLRAVAANVLKSIMEQYGPKYPGLLPRELFKLIMGIGPDLRHHFDVE